MALGGVGAVLGLGVGALIKTDRWEEVPPDHVPVSVVAQRGAFGIRARITF